MVICPPRAIPKVTAGLTWPPEMLAPTETATKRAKPWHTAIDNNPAGSSAASDVNLSAKPQCFFNCLCAFQTFASSLFHSNIYYFSFIYYKNKCNEYYVVD